MARRIARDVSLQIALGGVDDGSTPTWGTDVAIEGKAREISIDYNSDTVNLAGLSDSYARIRAAGSARFTIRISAFIPTTGYDFYVSGNPPLQHRARVKIKPSSTLEAPYEFAGVIRRWSHNTQAGEAQIEEIEIEGPLDV